MSSSFATLANLNTFATPYQLVKVVVNYSQRLSIFASIHYRSELMSREKFRPMGCLMATRQRRSRSLAVHCSYVYLQQMFQDCVKNTLKLLTEDCNQAV